MPIKDIPAEARPREKLLSRGPGALSDIELLAILLRTGIQGKGVLQMAEELLQLKNCKFIVLLDCRFDIKRCMSVFSSCSLVALRSM